MVKQLFLTTSGAVLRRGEDVLLLEETWDEIFALESVGTHLDNCGGRHFGGEISPLAPIGRQEVWAAGVTYFASREARIEESGQAGSADVYRRCYDAQRPELFLKATAHRVVGPDGGVRIRSDSSWRVPEPELVLACTSHGEVFGFTIGNDVSSRDIEGENPLYLPQAKVYDGCAALGPYIAVSDVEPSGDTRIAIVVERATDRGFVTVFAGSTSVSQIRRTFSELVYYLRLDNSFPHGCFLMTGTGVVPPREFTLQRGDVITITIDGLGTLRNTVLQSD